MRKKLSAILVIVVMLTLASSANALVSKQLGYKRVTSSSSAPVNFTSLDKGIQPIVKCDE